MMPKEYPFVLLACVLLALECIVFSFFTGRQRGKIFTKEYLSSLFGEEHTAQFKTKGSRLPENIPAGGFPDCGDGRYASKLPYKDWYIFN